MDKLLSLLASSLLLTTAPGAFAQVSSTSAATTGNPQPAAVTPEAAPKKSVTPTAPAAVNTAPAPSTSPATTPTAASVSPTAPTSGATAAPTAAPTPAPAATPAQPAAPLPANPVNTQLKDGTKIEIDSDGSVFILTGDGGKTVAPDGNHTLRDGTTFTVKGGKKSAD